MVTGSSSSSAKQTSASGLRALFTWSWARVVLFLLFAIGFGLPGILLIPGSEPSLSVFEPTIAVLASEQGVIARVDMTLSNDRAPTPSYSLTLTITPVNVSPQSVSFGVSFSGFPAPALGTEATPLPQNGYYATIGPQPIESGTASQEKPFRFTSSRPIGEKTDGVQLRVAFPDLVGEVPGSQYSYQACGITSTYAPICANSADKYRFTPVLEAGQTKLSSDNPSLGDYQFLAGDNPALLGGNVWTWSGINGVTMLAANVSAQVNQQNQVFYSGVLLGVAAGALIAFVTELLRPAWRKDPAEGAVSQTQPTSRPESLGDETPLPSPPGGETPQEPTPSAPH